MTAGDYIRSADGASAPVPEAHRGDQADGQSASGAAPLKCSRCASVMESPIVCQDCHTLYPLPKSTDHFELLGLPRAYAVDQADLHAQYTALSRNVHPDRHTAAERSMSLLATRISAELNEALRVLRDPVLRADYLLELCGGPSAATDRTVAPEVLSDAMMLREAVEEAQQAGDGQAAEQVRGTVDRKRATLLEQIGGLAAKLPAADADEKADLRHKLNAVKYYNNLLDLLWQ